MQPKQLGRSLFWEAGGWCCDGGWFAGFASPSRSYQLDLSFRRSFYHQKAFIRPTKAELLQVCIGCLLMEYNSEYEKASEQRSRWDCGRAEAGVSSDLR